MSNDRPLQPSKHVNRLSSDGELPDLDSLLDSAHDSDPAAEALAYCIYCGSANPHNASFCARCGKPLVDPDAFNVGRKSKRSDPFQSAASPDLRSEMPAAFAPQMAPMTWKSGSQAARWNFAAVFATLVRLGCVAGMLFMTMFSQSSGLLWAPLLAGFLIEAVRSGKRHMETFGSALIEIVTAGIVTGVYATLLFASHGLSAWWTLLVLLFWFLVEAVRS